MNEAGRATFGFTGWATGGGAALPQFLDTYDKNNDTRYTDCWIGGVQQDQSGNTIYVDGQPLNYTYESAVRTIRDAIRWKDTGW